MGEMKKESGRDEEGEREDEEKARDEEGEREDKKKEGRRGDKESANVKER